MLPRRKKPANVSHLGANTGQTLCGFGLNNQGLRLQLSQNQMKGNQGSIQGLFVILDVGDNMHSHALEHLLHRSTNAEEVVSVIRRLHPSCVNPVNANILAVEPDEVVDAQNSTGQGMVR